MNVRVTRPLIGLEMPTAATTPAAAIGETPDRVRLGGDNSVSPYRHNLLTAVFYGSIYLAAESMQENNII
jgi:hypothetical protein